MIPEAAVDNLINDIRIRRLNGPISEFERALFKKRAEKLMNTDPAQAYCALGVLAADAGNEAEARKKHMKALEYSSLPVFYYNYGVSIGHLGHYEEAITEVCKAIDSDVADLTYLNFAIWLAYKIEDSRLPLLLAKWENRTKGEQHPVLKEIDEELTNFCMISSHSSLAEVWDTPEEDEAWEHLQ